MEDKRSKQVFTIILCVALIVTTIIARFFMKDTQPKEENKEGVSVENVMDNKVDSLDEDDNETEKLIFSKNFVLDHGLDINLFGLHFKIEPIRAVDTSLYSEDTENEGAPEGMTEVRFVLTNGEVLYNQDFPSGIYKHMNEQIQNYINNNIKNPDEVTEIKIIKDTVQEDKENKILNYDIVLNTGTSISVEVDLYNFEYRFKVI